MSAVLPDAKLPEGFPPVDFERDALFLDIDGTMIDIAPTPESVVVPESLKLSLTRLREHLGGALAVISGRTLSAIDELFAPVKYAAAGAHGAEIRPDCMVSRVLLGDRGRASGVSYFRDGVEHRQRAKVVALAGYSIETPRLLLLSATPTLHSDEVGFQALLHLLDPVLYPLGAPPDLRRTIGLTSYASDATLVGDETLDGQPVRHYRFGLGAGGLLGPGSSPALTGGDLWVDAETHRFRRLVYTIGPPGPPGANAGTLQIDFLAYDVPVTLTPPPVP